MRWVVVDASVAVKWLLPTQPEEADVDQALQLLQAIRNQERLLLQPPHFLAELIGVIVRLAPDYAEPLFAAVKQMDIACADSEVVYLTALRMSNALNHHLFDTLYHAAALSAPDAVLITADAGYYRKAHGMGKILLLQDYQSDGPCQ